MARKRKKFVRILSSRITLFFLIIAVAAMAKVTFEKYIEVSKAKATLKQEEKKTKEAQQRLEKLETEIQYYQSKEYLESIARKKLNLAKPGEKVIYVIPEEKQNENEQKAESQEKKNKSFWERVKEFLKIDDIDNKEKK